VVAGVAIFDDEIALKPLRGNDVLLSHCEAPSAAEVEVVN